MVIEIRLLRWFGFVGLVACLSFARLLMLIVCIRVWLFCFVGGFMLGLFCLFSCVIVLFVSLPIVLFVCSLLLFVGFGVVLLFN